MPARSSILIILIQLVVASDALTCLDPCVIDDKSPQSLVVPDGKCPTTTAAACQIRLSFQFETGSYSVTFGTASVARYVVTTEARPPNYLNTFMTYSCTDSDSCALDFAKKKLVGACCTKIQSGWYFGRDLTGYRASILHKPANSLSSALDNDACSKRSVQNRVRHRIQHSDA